MGAWRQDHLSSREAPAVFGFGPCYEHFQELNNRRGNWSCRRRVTRFYLGIALSSIDPERSCVSCLRPPKRQLQLLMKSAAKQNVTQSGQRCCLVVEETFLFSICGSDRGESERTEGYFLIFCKSPFIFILSLRSAAPEEVWIKVQRSAQL